MITQPTRQTSGSGRTPVAYVTSHRHQADRSKRHCLKILRGLSNYIDDESPTTVCKEIRKHMGACPNCELFVESLRQTVSLCRQLKPHPLSEALKSRIRRSVLASGRPS